MNVSAAPAVHWSEKYGDNSFATANKLIQTSDGGYVLVGARAASQTLESKDIWFVKTDQNGIVQWNETYGGSLEDEAYDVLQNEDGGYTLVGYTTSPDTNEYDIFMIRTNAIGNVTWQKTAGVPSNDQATSLIQTIDGGYVIAGFTDYSGEESIGIILLKIDSEGEGLWITIISGSKIDKAWDLVQTQDGGFAIAGETTSSGSGGRDFWLVKTDSNGSMEWNQTYGGKNDDIAHSLIQTSDGGYILAGETRSYGSGANDCWLVKTDSNGSVEWSRTYGERQEDIAYSVIQTKDGGFALAGYSKSLFYHDFYLVKTDSNGYMEWHTNISSDGDARAYSLIQTQDEGYALAGSVQLPRYFNILMIKTNKSVIDQPNLFPIANAGQDVQSSSDEEISFTSTGSYDPDGNIVTYQWDFDGNGVYDWSSNTTDSTTYSYTEEGTYYALLKVTDNNGSSSTDMKTITVTPAQQETKTLGDIWVIFFLLFLLSLVFFIVLNFGERIKKKMGKIASSNKGGNWLFYLIASFITIFAVKFIVSLFFNLPWIHFDEHSYAVIAGNIAKGNLVIIGETPFADPYPAGYSYFLAPAYFLSNNMSIVYHGMLGINALLSTLAMFPVFFIMKHFVDKKISLATAILASILPTILIFNYLILNETLLFLVFLISCFLVIKTFTYESLDRRFILYSLALGCSVGFLVMIKATGIAMLAAIVCLFVYKLIKNRALSTFKYGLIFLPFIPVIIFVLLNPTFVVRYSYSFIFARLSEVFSSPSSFGKFVYVILNEINYLVIMSYVIFLAFTIFLFFYRDRIPKKQRNEISAFTMYSFFSILFLMFLTSLHMSYSDFSIYTRYISLGLLPIFMLGVIGMNVFLNVKDKTAKVSLGNICVLLGFYFILFFPIEEYNLVNNLDIFWITSLHNSTIFGVSGFTFLRIILGIFLIYAFISLNIKYFSKRNLLSLLKPAKNIVVLISLCLLVSPFLYLPGGAERSLYEEEVITDMQILEPAQWLNKNDPKATLIVEDSSAAYLGGGIDIVYWKYMYANLVFWFQSGEITIMNRSQLQNGILSDEIKADYILSTHDLTQFYPSVKDTYMNIPVSSHLKQDTVDWHIYQVNRT